MTADEYVTSRLDDQIAWYDRKSGLNQRSYKSLRVIEIALATSIPFLTGFISETRPGFQIAVGAAGVVIAVISGLLALNQYQENWIEYRTTCEALRNHRFKFLAGAHPYDGDDAFVMLVDQVEGLIAKENRKWAGLARDAGKKPDEASPDPGDEAAS